MRLAPCHVLVLFAFSVVGCASHNGASPKASFNASHVASRRASLAEISAGFGDNVRHELETLRTATDGYHDLSVAQAAGYPTNTPACVADSTMGGMGRHYFDRKIFDDKLDVAHPEMLLFGPTKDGKGEFVAVEYVVPFSMLPSTSVPPRLFGQELKRHEQFKYWYLHVWAWQKNSAGLFADWNPALKC